MAKAKGPSLVLNSGSKLRNWWLTKVTPKKEAAGAIGAGYFTIGK